MKLRKAELREFFRKHEPSSNRSVQRKFIARGTRRRDAVGRTTGVAPVACCLRHATDAHWRPPPPSTVCYDCQSPSASIVRDRPRTDRQKHWITVTDVKGCDFQLQLCQSFKIFSHVFALQTGRPHLHRTFALINFIQRRSNDQHFLKQNQELCFH